MSKRSACRISREEFLRRVCIRYFATELLISGGFHVYPVRHALDVAGVEGDAFEAEVREFFHGLGEVEELFAGRDADAAESDVDFGDDADLDLCGAGASESWRAANALSRATVTRVRRAISMRRGELRVADDVEGDEEVVGVGADHNLGFADLGNSEAGGAEVDLAAGHADRLVGFGVGAEVVVAGIAGDALEVVLHDVEVDDEGGGVDFGEVHVGYGIPARKRRR
jgi:hypothetical protein